MIDPDRTHTTHRHRRGAQKERMQTLAFLEYPVAVVALQEWPFVAVQHLGT